MRYEAKRHHLHPVLGPDNDDYPMGQLTVRISPIQQISDEISFSIDFNLTEPSLKEAIADSKARCKAMIYCSGTLYRLDSEAEEGEFTIDVQLPLMELAGSVDIHPFIVSTDGVQLITDRIHSEYGQQSTSMYAGKGQPLAVSYKYTFNVLTKDFDQDSIIVFEYDPNETLSEGEFDIRTDISERQIVIIGHRTTVDHHLMKLREDRLLALSSIYMSALVQAFCDVRSADDEMQSEACPNGWFQYLSGRQKEDTTPFLMAQDVFERPFAKLIHRVREGT